MIVSHDCVLQIWRKFADEREKEWKKFLDPNQEENPQLRKIRHSMARLLADALQRAEKAEQAAEQKDSLLDLMELQCGHLKTQKHSLEMGLERQSAALARMTSERDSLAFLLQNETNARTAAKTRAAFEIVSGLRALYCKWVACRVL